MDRYNRISAISLSILATFVIWYILIIAKHLFIPIVLSILLTAWLTSIFNRLRAKHIPVFLIFPIILIWLALFIYLFFSIILLNISQIASQADAYQVKIMDMFWNLSDFLAKYNINLGNYVNSNILNKVDVWKILQWILLSMKDIWSNIFLILLYTWFFFFGRKKLFYKLMQIIKSHKNERTLEKIMITLQDYIYYKTIISFGTWLATYLALMFFWVDFPLLWALLTFLLNFIPALGSFIAVFLMIIFAIFQFFSFRIVFLLAITLTSIQILFGNILEPKFLWERLNINPIFIILAVTVGWAVWWIIWMFIWVPILSIISIISKEMPSFKIIHTILTNN